MTIIEKQQIKNYHLKRLQQWKDRPSKALGWTSDNAQKIRFDVIASLADFNGVSLLDLGCGDGGFRQYLDQQYSNFDYIGLDQQPEFIAYARQRFGNQPNTWFFDADFERCQLPAVDVVVASGALSYRCDNPDYYIERIRQFYDAANHSLIFNMLDQDGFDSGPLLVSHDREKVYQQCCKICSQVTLKSGYLDNDFTIRMTKDIN